MRAGQRYSLYVPYTRRRRVYFRRRRRDCVYICAKCTGCCCCLLYELSDPRVHSADAVALAKFKTIAPLRYRVYHHKPLYYKSYLVLLPRILCPSICGVEMMYNLPRREKVGYSFAVEVARFRLV